jgi:hypothetical protein
MHNRRKLAGIGASPCALATALIASTLLPPERALAEEKEPFASVELGAAAEWNLPNGGSAGVGPSAAIEFNVIKDWLVIEPGVAPLFSRGQTEWDADLMFKKPFDLSSTVEFEPGIGPAWQHTIAAGRSNDNPAVEVIFEFMVRPHDLAFGWFVEPSYSNSFGAGHQQSLGMTTGLVFPIPAR